MLSAPRIVGAKLVCQVETGTTFGVDTWAGSVYPHLMNDYIFQDPRFAPEARRSIRIQADDLYTAIEEFRTMGEEFDGPIMLMDVETPYTKRAAMVKGMAIYND